jgi:Glycosyl transferases group 1
MLEVIRDLVDEGVENISWHVYGDGPLASEMKRDIVSLKLEAHVFMHGSVAYEKIHDALSDAFVFIGMGTSLIEAGLFGIPGIPAIDSCGPQSYGYTYNLNGYSVGENTGDNPDKPIASLLRKLINLSEPDYRLEQEKTRAHCLRFSMDVVGKNFVEYSDELGIFPEQTFKVRLYIYTHYIAYLLRVAPKEINDYMVVHLKKYAPRRILPFLRRLNKIIFKY